MNEPTIEVIEKVVDIAAYKAGLVICAIMIAILYGSWYLCHRYWQICENIRSYGDGIEGILMVWTLVNVIASVIVIISFIVNFYYILYANFR